MENTRLAIGLAYFKQKNWTLFPFQEQTWNDYLDGKSGLLNAPTGSGKTFALWFPVILEYIQNNPDTWMKAKKKNRNPTDMGHPSACAGTGYTESHAGSLRNHRSPVAGGSEKWRHRCQNPRSY
ncbi:DEAD/DEAH box helicase [Algoriphagus sp. NG3]|nr:DEAD/DEAH box helicase [Algoriphagus sp. NG3]WPR76690.1 DEAD/DEAH box helicase [Algoriphagus sp. NG3]